MSTLEKSVLLFIIECYYDVCSSDMHIKHCLFMFHGAPQKHKTKSTEYIMYDYLFKLICMIAFFHTGMILKYTATHVLFKIMDFNLMKNVTCIDKVYPLSVYIFIELL